MFMFKHYPKYKLKNNYNYHNVRPQDGQQDGMIVI